MLEAAEALLAVYPTSEDATAALGRLTARHGSEALGIVDFGLLRRDRQGKVALDEARAGASGTGANRPRIVAGLVGLIVPPNELASSIDGGSIAMVATHLKSTGVDGASLKRLGAVLDPGESAILVVVDRPSVEEVERALAGYAHLVRSRLGRPDVTPAATEPSAGDERKPS
jgi:uncharacterized membrane protein